MEQGKGTVIALPQDLIASVVVSASHINKCHSTPACTGASIHIS